MSPEEIGSAIDRVLHELLADGMIRQEARVALLALLNPVRSVWFIVSYNIGETRRSRTWGFALNRDDALRRVEQEAWHFRDGRYYSHVVVERIGVDDLWDRDETWFVLEGDDHDVVARPCERPEVLKGIAWFALG